MLETGESDKTCTTCGVTKPVAQFHRMGPTGRVNKCAKCRAASSKAWRSTEVGRTAQAKHKRSWLMKQHGITTELYEAIFAAQNGKCAICSKDSPPERLLAVDHDHASGVVRALLCTACNVQLGVFEAFQSRALQYLEVYGSGNPLLIDSVKAT